MNKLRLALLPLLLATLAVLAAGCGGGGSASGTVPADAVATVGSTPITKSDFDALIAGAKSSYKGQNKAFPAVGTPAYSQIRDEAVKYLVQGEEIAQEGAKLGVNVTAKDISAKIKQDAQTYEGGSMPKLVAALKKVGLTLSQYETQTRLNLVDQDVYTKVTAPVTVSNADVKKYYDQNKATYNVRVPETREVAHILVSSKSLANKLEQKLKSGANFADLARKYSKDTGSAANGGKLCVAHGTSTSTCSQTVAPFDKASFSLKTGEISAPVHSVYGWHIIEALSPIKPPHTEHQSLKQVSSTIQQNLLQQRKTAAWQTWIKQLTKDFKGKVAYQTGYSPTKSTSAGGSTTTPATTTG